MPGPFRRKARAASTIYTPVVGGAIRCSNRVVSGLAVSITVVVAVMIPDLWWPRAAAESYLALGGRMHMKRAITGLRGPRQKPLIAPALL